MKTLKMYVIQLDYDLQNSESSKELVIMQLFNRIITIITYKFLARLKNLETMKVWCIWERHAERQTVCKRNLGMGLFDMKIFMNCYEQILMGNIFMDCAPTYIDNELLVVWERD